MSLEALWKQKSNLNVWMDIVPRTLGLKLLAAWSHLVTVFYQVEPKFNISRATEMGSGGFLPTLTPALIPLLLFVNISVKVLLLLKQIFYSSWGFFQNFYALVLLCYEFGVGVDSK